MTCDIQENVCRSYYEYTFEEVSICLRDTSKRITPGLNPASSKNAHHIMQRDIILEGSCDYFAKREREAYTTKPPFLTFNRRGFTPTGTVAQHHSIAIST